MAHTLLLVDDEPAITSALRRVLRPDGYQILTANSAQQALQLLDKQTIDVVVSDYRMPGMTGPELLRQVARQCPEASRLMLSGAADLQPVIAAMNEGTVHQFLTKPWSCATIRATIRDATNQINAACTTRDQHGNTLTRAGLEQLLNRTARDGTPTWSHVLGLSIANPTTFDLLQNDGYQHFIDALKLRMDELAVAHSEFGRIGREAIACAVQTDNIEDYLSRLANALRAPLRLGNARLFVRAHLAITDAGTADASVTVQELLTTLSSLESAPPGSWRRYQPTLRANLHHRYTLEQDLFNALRRNELFFQVQPQHNTRTRRVCGGELLSRWRHRTHGLIAPLEFIDMAERSGVIQELGEWALRSGIQMAKLVEDQGARISINLSPRQFALQDLTETVEHLLVTSGAAAHNVELEITESSVMQNLADAQRTLESLKGLGVRIALDDFGTGHSSLSQLHMLNLDTLKFDRSFIASLGSEPVSLTLLTHVVRLAEDLGLETVAEGVETQEQYDTCRELGIDRIQGFYFNRPLSANDFVVAATRSAAH